MSPRTDDLDAILAAHSGPSKSSSKKPKLTDLEAAEQKHVYLDPRARERVTSVTTVVGTFDSGDKLGNGARAAVALERQGLRYEDEWGAKKDTGTRVHEYIEYWANGKRAEVREEDNAHMDAFAEWCDVVQPEWIVTERAGVGSVECPNGVCGVCKWTGRLGFGGRFDGIFGWGDLFCLGDVKTGKSWRPELTIQLAGYANLDGLILYDDKGMAVGLEPLPHIDIWCGIYVRPEGVEVVQCPDPGKIADDWTLDQMKAEAFKTFTSLLYCKEWSKQINRVGR